MEGVPLTGEGAAVVAMFNRDRTFSDTLGDAIPWVLTVTIEEESSRAPSSAFLSQTEAHFAHGIATFENITFSHPGDYNLIFSVTEPLEADFQVVHPSVVTVAPRRLGLRILQQPRDGNFTFELYPYPSVELVDLPRKRALLLFF